MAQRIAAKLEALGHPDLKSGILDITFHRDDLHNLEAMLDLSQTQIEIGDLAERCVILFDDVLYTGRTIRAAIDEILDFGRPKRIELAVVAERDGRELPIQADYVGHVFHEGQDKYVKVWLTPKDPEDAIWVDPARRPAPRPNL
jgi:pyrimidine operon attenuation protein / uracil phosphoribosyltransferase